MSVLDFIALLLLVIIAFLIGVLLWYLGGLPGRVAKKHQHPYEKSIAIGGWATLIFGGIGWPFVLMWAYASMNQGTSSVRSDSQEDDFRNELGFLRAKVESLSKQVEADGGAER